MLFSAILFTAAPLLGLVVGRALIPVPVPGEEGIEVRLYSVNGILRECYEHNGHVLYCVGDNEDKTTTVTLVPASTTTITTTTTTHAEQTTSYVIITAPPITTTHEVTETTTITTTSTEAAKALLVPRGADVEPAAAAAGAAPPGAKGQRFILQLQEEEAELGPLRGFAQ